jgi:hypothetical protein
MNSSSDIDFGKADIGKISAPNMRPAPVILKPCPARTRASSAMLWGIPGIGHGDWSPHAFKLLR